MQKLIAIAALVFGIAIYFGSKLSYSFRESRINISEGAQIVLSKVKYAIAIVIVIFIPAEFAYLLTGNIAVWIALISGIPGIVTFIYPEIGTKIRRKSKMTGYFILYVAIFVVNISVLRQIGRIQDFLLLPQDARLYYGYSMVNALIILNLVFVFLSGYMNFFHNRN